MIGKLILIIVVSFVVYFIFFRNRKIKPNSKNTNNEETLVKCVKCSTYITQDNALSLNGDIFCSTECKEA
jgi:formylmethanofuran dehydrogenase subunit E